MSSWGPWCVKCGHPAAYHGTSFCMVRAGADAKKDCDCDGYRPGQQGGDDSSMTVAEPQYRPS